MYIYINIISVFYTNDILFDNKLKNKYWSKIDKGLRE